MLRFSFSPVQNSASAKQFLIKTEDDVDAMKSDKFGYDDEDAFKQAMKPRRVDGNRSASDVVVCLFLSCEEI